MSDQETIPAGSLTPILCVRDFQEAVDYYTNKLRFKVLWEWGDPPGFGCVRLGKVEIFFCLNGQGSPGTWMSIFMDDVDGYCHQITALGAEVVYGPQDEPWGCREIHVRDPNGHVIRFSQGIPARKPEMQIDRAPLTAPIEKRLLALIEDLAGHKNMTVGEMLEETLLHSFEEMPEGGVASPHTVATLAHIRELREKHGIDYDSHASYRFVEKPED